MKASDFLFGAVVGIVASYLWYNRKDIKKASSNPKLVAIQEEVAKVQDVIEEEASKFSGALKSEYEIVMPSDRVSKKAKVKAKEFTKGRYSVDPTAVKDPLSL